MHLVSDSDIHPFFQPVASLSVASPFLCGLYWKNKGKDRTFRFVWLYILLSFLFYIPVAVAAGIVPALGMLMLPKTVCYVLLIVAFLKAAGVKRA